MLLDKEAFKTASKLYFKEHSEVDFANDQIEIEKLEDYFNIPPETFSFKPEVEFEYQKSKNAIKKVVLK